MIRGMMHGGRRGTQLGRSRSTVGRRGLVALVCACVCLAAGASVAQADGEQITLSPKTATNPVGTQHTVTATVTVGLDRIPLSGATVLFTVSGANSASGSSTTNANGQTTFTYTGTNPGTDTITAVADENRNGKQDPLEPFDTASKLWTGTPQGPPPSGGCTSGTNDPDRNGDLHSHCHTGSKGRGAGGEDKSGSKQR